MKISKKLIIKALKIENLAQGEFFNVNFDFSNKHTCPVCAVGAVLRKSLKPSQLPETENELHKLGLRVTNYDAIVNSNNESEWKIGIQESLIKKNYLSALSKYFESTLCLTKSGDVSRRKLVNFVKKHFPSVITLDIE